ncbi:hypothetical protein GCM10018772_10030 [Streptomyces fumanus]|uniref:Uncharacterized protein n=1 Tax=Streptomyces fumanus TaxID=67302 RepID=A0A919DXE9_9ACTN|nr:hypothetical protein GCM10018772_10030 [Streptomyces fumanus]
MRVDLGDRGPSAGTGDRARGPVPNVRGPSGDRRSDNPSGTEARLGDHTWGPGAEIGSGDRDSIGD